MKKIFIFFLFSCALIVMPFQVYADNGNHYGLLKNGKKSHGVPDPGSALSLLGIGMAAVGGYRFFFQKKKDE